MTGKWRYKLIEPAVDPMSYGEMVRWIAALRSGDYRQGIGGLKKLTSNGTEFCCLGVEQEIHRVHTDSTSHLLAPVVSGDQVGRAGIRLPIPAQKWLTSLNDLHKHSFQEIAQRIETHLLPWAALKESFGTPV